MEPQIFVIVILYFICLIVKDLFQEFFLLQKYCFGVYNNNYYWSSVYQLHKFIVSIRWALLLEALHKSRNTLVEEFGNKKLWWGKWELKISVLETSSNLFKMFLSFRIDEQVIHILKSCFYLNFVIVIKKNHFSCSYTLPQPLEASFTPSKMTHFIRLFIFWLLSYEIRTLNVIFS